MTGLIALSETVEGIATVDLDRLRTTFDAPVELPAHPGGLHYRMHDLPGLAIEARLAAKLDAVRAFAYANPIDRLVVSAPRATVGIVTCGKAHLDLLEALRRLDISLDGLEAVGVRVYKVGLVFPLEPRRMLDFVRGLGEVLVVEEKAAVVENQLRALLYNQPTTHRPRLLGKLIVTVNPCCRRLESCGLHASCRFWRNGWQGIFPPWTAVTAFLRS